MEKGGFKAKRKPGMHLACEVHPHERRPQEAGPSKFLSVS